MPVTAAHVTALVRRYLERDDEGFYSVALQVAARAARDGNTKFAQELRDLIQSARAPAVPRLAPTPITQPRGELAGLMSVRYPTVSMASLVISDPVRRRLKRVLHEQRQRDRLNEHGLEPVHRLLLVGPPGTGKSMSAAVLAHELNLPLFTIQLDALISKYMGETASKLRLVFDAVASTRAVYLFDEFDALGAERSVPTDVGEARRVLNSFLQFLEHSSPSSLVVAATNHPQMLDTALNRRFDDVIEFGLPDKEHAVALMRNRLALLDTSSIDWEAVAGRASGLSHADLVRAAEAAAKAALLEPNGHLSTAGLVAEVQDRMRDVDD
jgi:SpoVK/Ycf46/Vps4 family AAA+-type ATPase